MGQHNTGPKCPHCGSHFTDVDDAKKHGGILGVRLTPKKDAKVLFCHDCSRYAHADHGGKWS